jgi:hypothetical protein
MTMVALLSRTLEGSTAINSGRHLLGDGPLCNPVWDNGLHRFVQPQAGYDYLSTTLGVARVVLFGSDSFSPFSGLNGNPIHDREQIIIQ